MDRNKIRMGLMASLGQQARKQRLAKGRQKYQTGNPALDAVAASQDEAVEAAEMPTAEGLGLDVSDVDSGADAAAPAIAEAMGDPDEDEEMAKWMAKQKG